jgi:hypothetical protein
MDTKNLKRGQEQSGIVATRDGEKIRYDYQPYQGSLFTCLASSLEDAREKRDKALTLRDIYGNEPF